MISSPAYQGGSHDWVTWYIWPCDRLMLANRLILKDINLSHMVLLVMWQTGVAWHNYLIRCSCCDVSELAQLMCLNLLETCTTHNTAILGFYVLILGLQRSILWKSFRPLAVVVPLSNEIYAQGCMEVHRGMQRYTVVHRWMYRQVCEGLQRNTGCTEVCRVHRGTWSDV